MKSKKNVSSKGKFASKVNTTPNKMGKKMTFATGKSSNPKFTSKGKFASKIKTGPTTKGAAAPKKRSRVAVKSFNKSKFNAVKKQVFG
jgi:hypothetical protein